MAKENKLLRTHPVEKRKVKNQDNDFPPGNIDAIVQFFPSLHHCPAPPLNFKDLFWIILFSILYAAIKNASMQ